MRTSKDIEAYLDALPTERRQALERLRKLIRAAAPRAEECIRYQLPAFDQDGMLVAFGATVNHCAFYLMSGTVLGPYQAELGGFEVSKGTIRFHPDKPLPAAMVKKLVRARVAENTRRKQEREKANR